MEKKQIIEVAIKGMIDSNVVDIESGKLPPMTSMQMVKMVTFSEVNGIGIGSSFVPKIEGIVDQLKDQVSSTGNEVMAISIITFDGQFKSEVIRYDGKPNRVSDVKFDQASFSMN